MVMRKFPLMGLLLLITIVGSPTTAEGPGESVNEPVCPVTLPEEGFHRGFFPRDFLFGTATASYQVEGGVYKTNRGRSMWDVYCMKYPKKCNYENGDVAVDFFNRYKEDIQLMKNLNTNAFRLSISWPRIFPYGKKERGVSKDGVRFYHDLIDELNNYGITPFVTLFHWDIPQDLEDEYGGFVSDKIVKDFKDYAELLFDEFGGKVKNWITINEPWVYAHAGYDVGKKAPGRCSKYVKADCVGGESGNEAYNVSHNLLNAHAEAVESFRKCEKCKDGKIGLAHCPFWFESYVKDNKPADPVVGRALDFMLGWHLDPTTTGDYPKTMRDAVGDRLPKFTTEQSAKLKGSADFIGLNYYVSKFPKELESKILKNPRWLQDLGVEWQEFNEEGYRIGSRPKDAIEDMSINSEGLRSLLKHIKKNYGDQEIMIMENGYGDLPAEKAEDVSVKVGIDDNNRKFYLWRHLYSLYEAICIDKVNVKGYFVWSLLDNFEWQDGYKVRFGLYFVDFKNNLTRHEKKSGKFYREFLRIRPAQIKNVPSTTKTEL